MGFSGCSSCSVQTLNPNFGTLAKIVRNFTTLNEDGALFDSWLRSTYVSQLNRKSGACTEACLSAGLTVSPDIQGRAWACFAPTRSSISGLMHNPTLPKAREFPQCADDWDILRGSRLVEAGSDAPNPINAYSRQPQ